MIDPSSVAGCGNGSNYCDLGSLYVPAFTPTACTNTTSTGGVSHTKLTVYTLPAGCTATVEAEFRKRNYFGAPVNPSGVGCSNSGMDGSPDRLSITQSGGVITSQGSTIVVNVGTCSAYPALGTYVTTTSTLSPGCANADGYVQMILTGGTFSVGGASNRADELITFTVNFSGTCGPSCSSVLPIELLDFRAEPKSDYVSLQWHVASEINTKEYIIEKSPDAVNWKTIGTITADPVYNTNLFYYANDVLPFKGINYYRLTDIDLDGTQNPHEVIFINYLNKSTHLLSEQTEDDLVVSCNAFYPGISLNIFDISGRLIKTVKISGESSVRISKSELGKGLFLLGSPNLPQAGFSKVVVY